MKNLLSVLAVSTLVGTSASNLKPVFTNTNINYGFKSNQINNKTISIKKQNDANPFVSKINKQKNIKSLAIDSNENIWAIIGTEIFKSTNNFKTFEQVKKGFPSGAWISNVNSLVIDKSRTIWVATANYEGLYKSTDNGKNFEQVKMKGFPNSIIDKLVVSQNGDIYGSNQSQIYKSTDNGKNFEQVYQFKVVKQIKSIFIDKNNDIYVGTSQGLWKSTDGTNFEQVTNGIPNDINILSITVGSNRNIYVGGESGLYKSNNGTDFKKINNIFFKNYINPLIIFTNQILFVTDDGLYKIDLLDNLLKINNPDYFGNKYNGFIYKQEQKIDIKKEYLVKAALDGKSITIPTTDLEISIGEHNLILTLKDEYKKYLDLFNGDILTGKVTYKFWIKNIIDKKDIQYSTNVDDTDLTNLSLGFISNFGNTNNADIIQTKIKKVMFSNLCNSLF